MIGISENRPLRSSRKGRQGLVAGGEVVLIGTDDQDKQSAFGLHAFRFRASCGVRWSQRLFFVAGKRDFLIPDVILKDKGIKYIQFHPHPGGKLAFNFYVGDGEENSPDFKTEFTMSMIINLNTVVSEYLTALDSLGRVRISGPRSIP